MFSSDFAWKVSGKLFSNTPTLHYSILNMKKIPVRAIVSDPRGAGSSTGALKIPPWGGKGPGFTCKIKDRGS
jgi:hypothetical protein